MLGLWVGLSLLACARAARVRGKPASSPPARPSYRGYTFERFVRDFGRKYEPHSAEYHKRAGLFESSLVQIHATNMQNAEDGRSWVAGVHKFMDWTEAEKRSLHGYKPSSEHRRTAALQVGAAATAGRRAAARSNSTWGDGGSGDTSAEDICGSCWAISAVEAVEAQLMKQSGGLSTRLSAQALVDCVPNPQKCGGTGGCDGATGELAYQYMRDHGIPVDSDLPYTGRTDACGASFLQSSHGMRARVSGWQNLPSNQAEPVKQALLETGPVVVAVDGGDWFDYNSGIFDGCSKDSVLSHAVLVKGFGEDGGKKYWNIQNSWGKDWGEHGNIRLLRHEDDRAYCGWDNKPQDGVGCEGGPPKVEVCGMCGLLYDPVVPTGVYLEQGSGGAQKVDSGSSAVPSDALASPDPFSKADALADSLLPSTPTVVADAAAPPAPDSAGATTTPARSRSVAEMELAKIMSSMKI